MEVISFNLSKLLTRKCLEMNEDTDFADRFVENIEVYERAKNVNISRDSIVKAVEVMYGANSLKEIFKLGTSYDKKKKEILGLYTMLMRHIKGASHRVIATKIKADYTTIYKNYSWYMIRLYKDSDVRAMHDGALNFIVEHYKYSV